MTITETDFAREWRAWRQDRLEKLRKPYGLLAPKGLHWLLDEPQTFDTVPGRWRLTPDGVVVEAEARAGLRVGGRLVDGEATIPIVARGGPLVEHGRVAIGVMAYPAVGNEPAQVAIQPRDPGSPAHTGFDGIPAYDPDPRWVVPARFERYETGRPEIFGTVVETLRKNLTVFGRVVVELEGGEYSLEVYSSAVGELHIPFRDLTSGKTTFAVRLLAVRWPEGREGENFEFLLDFNRAMNLPCTFTDHTTCALAPAGNALPFAIEAGEKLPAWRPLD
ncbi:DUF1684 domain-containing protein [Actinomadura rubrisoli]|uniref:DUF1684 domain-containing protein n=1 Tax=Actinomadura rubrisoli TaxID=2530368 RepID=A0A4R5AKP5_9ACTN|nr:DUF1684 domain-containing protein [Actinomadura rubrisoli]TDD73468.1 DUF1684 domain-containing protein [Actinomadura rubrisoli]